jgi:topoisomerase-4 subunit A
MRTDEFVCDCSDLDDIIVIRRDGTMLVTKIAEKTFVGKDILYINVFKRNDERTIYNLIYRDGARGNTMIKRFAVTSVIRDKDYLLTRGNPNSEILYLSANPNGEAEVVTVNLKANATARNKVFDADFAELAIKGRDAMGNILTKHPVRKVTIKEKGISTLTAQKIWFDDTVLRLNAEEHGRYLGEFEGDDKIVVITKDGGYRTCGFEFTTHFDADTILIEKLNTNNPLTAVYWEGEKKKYYIKRFLPEESEKKMILISETPGSILETVSADKHLLAEVKFRQEKGKELPDEKINVTMDIPVMGIKAQGKPINLNKVKEITLVPDPNQPGDMKLLDADAEKGIEDFEDAEMSPVEQAREEHKIIPVVKTPKPSKPKNKPKAKGPDTQPTLF